MADLKQLISQYNSSNEKKRTQTFSKMVVTTLGASPKEYFPKLKDEFGKTKKDAEGKEMRSLTPAGWSYKFCTLGDNPKIVMAVYPELLDLPPLTAMAISGEGYDIKSSNMIFLEQAEFFELKNEEE